MIFTIANRVASNEKSQEEKKLHVGFVGSEKEFRQAMNILELLIKIIVINRIFSSHPFTTMN